jgi:hypothetical protein
MAAKCKVVSGKSSNMGRFGKPTAIKGSGMAKTGLKK